MQYYDRAYKRLFSHPEMVVHLLRLVPEKWIRKLRWGTLRRVSTVLVANLPLQREADMVWRLRPRGQQSDLYLILEFRSSPDRHMPIRMLGYVVLLCQELVREKLLRGTKYPPIFGAVVYTGRRPWKTLREIRRLMEDRPEGIEKYLPRHRFVMLDAVRLSSRQVRVPGNLVSALFGLEACRSPSQMLQELRHLDRLLRAPGREELRRSFASWLFQAYLPSRLGRQFPEFEEKDIEEVSKMIELREDAWCLQWKRQGFEEGRREGQRALFRNMLEQRFGKLDKAHQQRIDSASAKALQAWSRRLLSARTLEGVFADQG